LNYKHVSLYVCMAWRGKPLPSNNVKFLHHIIVDHLFPFYLSSVTCSHCPCLILSRIRSPMNYLCHRLVSGYWLVLVAYQVALQALVQDRNIALPTSSKVTICRIIFVPSKCWQQVRLKR
jgi:hypothetical protein